MKLLLLAITLGNIAQAKSHDGGEIAVGLGALLALAAVGYIIEGYKHNKKYKRK